MRRTARRIFLLAIFLAGYYVGQQPDSPDIFGYAADAYHWIAESVGRPTADATEVPETGLDPAGPAQTFGSAMIP